MNSKQIRYLRSLANPLKPYFQVGKEGVNFNQTVIIRDALEVHELIKISVLKSCPEELDSVAEQLVRATGSILVQIIGHTIVLYRKSREPKIVIPS